MTKAGNHQGRSSAHITPLLSTELSTESVHSVQADLSGGDGGLRSGPSRPILPNSSATADRYRQALCAMLSERVQPLYLPQPSRWWRALTNSLFRHTPAQPSAELGETSSASQIDPVMSTSHHHVAGPMESRPPGRRYPPWFTPARRNSPSSSKLGSAGSYKFKGRFT